MCAYSFVGNYCCNVSLALHRDLENLSQTQQPSIMTNQSKFIASAKFRTWKTTSENNFHVYFGTKCFGEDK